MLYIIGLLNIKNINNNYLNEFKGYNNINIII